MALRLFKRPPLWGLLFFILILPNFATYDPRHAEAGHELETPSAEYWFGTDHLGRDLWSRVMVGGRSTLLGALLGTGIAIGGGLLLASGQMLGWRWNKYLTGVLLDALLAFPALLLALVIRTLLDPNLLSLALSIGVAGVAPYARVAVDALKTAQHAPHIEGAHSIGASNLRILVWHIIPTALPTLSAFGSVMFGWMILYQSALMFIGLGGDPAQVDWGLMLQQGRGYLEIAPQLVFAPGLMIGLCIWWANRLADG